MNRAGWNAYWRRALWAIPIATAAAIAEVQHPEGWVSLYLISIGGILCAISVSSGRVFKRMSVDHPAPDEPLRWKQKCTVGGALALTVAGVLTVQVAAVYSLSHFFLFFGGSLEPPGWLSALILSQLAAFLALEGFVWGMFWTTPSRSRLAALTLAGLSLFFVCLVVNFGDGTWVGLIVDGFLVRSLVACAILCCSWQRAESQPAATGIASAMKRVFAWKEFREQWPVWVTMTLLDLLAVGAIRYFAGGAKTPAYSLALVLATLIIPAAYALICAGMMLAGEAENRTLRYLDALALTRTQAWEQKCWLGAWFVATQAAVAAGVLLCLGPSFQPDERIDLGAALAVVVAIVLPALVAFSFGMFTSAVCRTVLGAVAAGAVISGATVGFFASQPRLTNSLKSAVIFPCIALACLALYSSWRRFCKIDTQRVKNEISGPLHEPSGETAHGGFAPAIGIALAIGAGAGIPVLLSFCLVVLPPLRAWQAAMATASAIWLMVLATLMGRQGVSLLWPRRRPWVSNALRAVAIACVLTALFFALLLVVVSFGGSALQRLYFDQVPTEELLPATALLFACWWFFVRVKRASARALRSGEHSAAA